MSDELTDPQGERHALYLGDEHWLNWAVATREGPRIGAIIFHRRRDGQPGYLGNGWCATTSWFDREHAPAGRTIWTLQGAPDEHITLSPSIVCVECGDHGFVVAGKWRRA